MAASLSQAGREAAGQAGGALPIVVLVRAACRTRGLARETWRGGLVGATAAAGRAILQPACTRGLARLSRSGLQEDGAGARRLLRSSQASGVTPPHLCL